MLVWIWDSSLIQFVVGLILRARWTPWRHCSRPFFLEKMLPKWVLFQAVIVSIKSFNPWRNCFRSAQASLTKALNLSSNTQRARNLNGFSILHCTLGPSWIEKGRWSDLYMARWSTKELGYLVFQELLQNALSIFSKTLAHSQVKYGPRHSNSINSQSLTQLLKSLVAL